MAHCVLAQWVIVTKLISQYLKNNLLIQDKDKSAVGSLLYTLCSFNYGAPGNPPGKHHEWFPSIFFQISSTKLTMPCGMCYSLFSNGVCNGAISIMQHCFIND